MHSALGVGVLPCLPGGGAPANPAGLGAGVPATPQELASARAELHLDDPLPVQFGYYLTGLVQGDLGVSIRTHNPVLDDIGDKLPATLELISASLLLAVVVGIPLGVYAGVKKGRWPDHLTRFLAVGGVSLPSFWLPVVFEMAFVAELQWRPSRGRVSGVLNIQ